MVREMQRGRKMRNKIEGENSERENRERGGNQGKSARERERERERERGGGGVGPHNQTCYTSCLLHIYTALRSPWRV